MNSYETKQAERRERLTRAAERTQAASDARFARAHAAVAGIPFGQPILVDHHSAPRHRAALRRQETNMRQAVALADAAKDLAHRAAAVGSAGVSSDDPDAVAKLTAKRDALIAERERGKAANVAFRKGDDARLLALTGRTRAEWDAELAPRSSFNRLPMAPCTLTNRGAEIRRLEQRIAQLSARAAEVAARAETGASDPTTTIGPVTIVDDAAENRVCVHFPKDLEALRAVLKRHGFRWSPSRTAWVRHRGGFLYERTCQLVAQAVTA